MSRPAIPLPRLSSWAATWALAMHDGPQMPAVPHIGINKATRNALDTPGSGSSPT